MDDVYKSVSAMKMIDFIDFDHRFWFCNLNFFFNNTCASEIVLTEQSMYVVVVQINKEIDNIDIPEVSILSIYSRME